MNEKIYFISGNKGKISEFKNFIPSIQAINLDIKEIQSLDLKEILKYKLDEAFTMLETQECKDFDFLIVEDTSLFINSLNGLPGPFIKFFLESLGNEGLLKLIYSFSNNNIATAITNIGIKDKLGKYTFFEGKIDGVISPEPLGENGFGWDNIFIPNGSTKTFAQMNQKEKDNFSMRKIAIIKLKKYFSSRI